MLLLLKIQLKDQRGIWNSNLSKLTKKEEEKVNNFTLMTQAKFNKIKKIKIME